MGEARPAPSGSAGFRIPGLDGLRAVAVLLVFIGHADLPTVVGAGTGVTVFFFLSGYLITTLLRRERAQTGRIGLRDFYLRRALRILPPLYVFLAVSAALGASGEVTGSVSGVGLAAALLHYTNFVMLFGNSSLLLPGAGVLWSLAVEEHFYLVFPLLYLAILPLSRKWQGVVLGALCSSCLVWRCVLVLALGGDYDRTYYGTDTRADALLLGCLLAVVANPVLDRVRMRSTAALPVLCAGGLLVVAGEQLPAAWAATVGQTLQDVGLFVAFTAILSAPRSLAGRVLEWRPLARLGVLSYTFYLFHGLALTVLEDHTQLGTYPRAAVAFLGTLAVSQAVHVGVERPLARLRRRLSHQRPAPTATVPGAVGDPAPHATADGTLAEHRPG
jgi:peptidoglycan/LPS O-acetylase OafA/YrhL